MKTKFALLFSVMLYASCAFAQTEAALVKTDSGNENAFAFAAPAAPAAAQPAYCNYQVTSLSGTCHNIAIGDILCKNCDASGVCPPRSTCTKGNCTVNVTLFTSICTGCLNHGHHAHAWLCQ